MPGILRFIGGAFRCWMALLDGHLSPRVSCQPFAVKLDLEPVGFDPYEQTGKVD